MSDAFSTLLADPPWLERGSGKIKRGADRHYALLPTEEIPGVIRGSGLWRPAENSHFYLFTTNNFLRDALWVMEELEFAYKTNVVWTKRHIGIGRYFRGAHELLLFGVRGRGMDPSVVTDRRNIPSVVAAEHVRVNGKRIHSAKPSEIYDLVEARSKGPYVEFFARSHRPNWTAWGAEAPALSSTGAVVPST